MKFLERDEASYIAERYLIQFYIEGENLEPIIAACVMMYGKESTQLALYSLRNKINKAKKEIGEEK